MTRRRPSGHANHERWLVSYADFITMLFAFFVVMFAASQKDAAKQMSESVRNALGDDGIGSAFSSALGHGKNQANKIPVNPDPAVTHATPPAAEPERHRKDLAQSLETLEKGLKVELDSGKVRIQSDSRGITISLREAAFFGSGDATVNPASLPILEKIAAVVRNLPNSVRLEGHTDSIPIHNARYRNNWELSTSRAIAMLEFLRDRFEIPSERMAVAGYAENAAADTNETVEGRAHNRRVDLVILSAQGMKSEPVSGSAGR